MNQSSDQHHISLGLLHVLPMLVIGVRAISLWRPANDPAPSPEQEKRSLISSVSSVYPLRAPARSMRRLRSFGPFPRTSRRAALSLTVS